MNRVAASLYRLALWSYPESFRNAYREAMMETFEARLNDRGVSILPRELTDVVMNGLRERWSEHEKAPPRRVLPELWLKDARQAVRALCRSPGFTLVAVSSLALGIGANSAIFTVVNGFLIAPMPVDAPDELVAIYATESNDRFPSNFSYPNYLDIARESSVFSEVVGFQGAPVSFNAQGQPELVWSELVTDNYFDGLGVKADRGRVFNGEDAGTPVTVVSHAFWQTRFQGDPEIVGTNVDLNGRAFTIVGVATQGFTGAKMLAFSPDLWVPLAWHRDIRPDDEKLLERRTGSWLNLRGRLADGVSLEEASAALETIAARLERAHPDANEDWQLHAMPAPRKVEPFMNVMTGGALPVAAGFLLGIVGIVLLIACANVASLTVARSLAREKEMALRVSLGASRTRVLRQLFLESAALCTAAGAIGFWLSGRIVNLATRLMPRLDFEIDFGFVPDTRVLWFTIGVSVTAAMLAAFLPAVRTFKKDPGHTLMAPSAARTTTWRRFIVVPQLALSLVALVTATLLVRSFNNQADANVGFNPEGLLLSSFNLGLGGYDEPAAREFHQRLVDRVTRLDAVSAASLASPLPLDAYQERAVVFPWEADPENRESGISLLYSVVHEDYFDTIGTPLLYGRGFEPRDTHETRAVAVVNATLARTLAPDENAVGRSFRFRRDGEPVEIIGVARDGKYLTLGEDPSPYLYLPLRQNDTQRITLLVRSDAEPRELEASLRNVVSSLDPTLPLYGVKTAQQFLDRSLSASRALALTVSLFAALALTLATLGVYGLMSFAVSQRRRELGIRMALGAGRGDIVRLFLRQAGRVVLPGLSIGLVFSWLSTRAMESLLFGVGTREPSVFILSAVVLGSVALAGSYIPTRRAARLDPLVTLRHE